MLKKIMLFLFCFTLATGAEFNEKKRSRDFEPLEIDSVITRNKLQKNQLHLIKEQLEIAWQLHDFETCKKLISKFIVAASMENDFAPAVHEIHQVLMSMQAFPLQLFNQQIRPYLVGLLNTACLQNNLYIVSIIVSIINYSHGDLQQNTLNFLFEHDHDLIFKALYESIQSPSPLLIELVKAFPLYQSQAILNYFCPDNLDTHCRSKNLNGIKKSLPNKLTKTFLKKVSMHGSCEAFFTVLRLRPYLMIEYGDACLFDVCNSGEHTALQSEIKLQKISYLIYHYSHSFDFMGAFTLYAKNMNRIGLEQIAPFLQPIDPEKATRLLQTACVYRASADFFRLLFIHATGFILDVDVATEMLQEAIINELPIEVIMFLINAGADIQACFIDIDDTIRGNILHLIAESSSVDSDYVRTLTKFFIDIGVSTTTENYLLDTPLMTAVGNSALPCIEELVKHPTTLTRNSRGNSIFHVLLDPASDYSDSYSKRDFMQSHEKYLKVWKYLLTHLSSDVLTDLLFAPNNIGIYPIQKNQNRPLSAVIHYLLDDFHDSASSVSLLELLEKSGKELDYTITLQPVDMMISRSIESQATDRTYENCLNAMNPDMRADAGTFSTWMRLRHSLPVAPLNTLEINNIVQILHNRMEDIFPKLSSWEDQQAFNTIVGPLLKTCFLITTEDGLVHFYESCKSFIRTLIDTAHFANLKTIQGTCYANYPWLDPYYDEIDRVIGWERKQRWCFYNPESLFLSLFFTSVEIYELCLTQIRAHSECNMMDFLLLIHEEYDMHQLRDNNGNTLLFHALSEGNVPFSMYVIARFPQMLTELNIHNKTAMDVFARNAFACKKLVEIAQYERLSKRALTQANSIINEKKVAQSVANCFDQTID